jgi:hypothetical protein
MIIDGEVSEILAIQVVSQPSTLHSSDTIAARHSRNATGLAAPGYNWRTLVEADISRFKRVIGDGLRSRTDRRRAIEVAIALRALNKMLELGRPEYGRLP